MGLLNNEDDLVPWGDGHGDLPPDLGPGIWGWGIEGFARRAELRVLTLRFPDGESGLGVDGKDDNFVAVGSYTSMSKGQAMVGGLLRIHLYGETWRTRWAAGWMWDKSVLPLQRIKTIRIAESSDMDSWETLLWPCASFGKAFKSKRNWNGDVVAQLYQMEW